MNALHRPRFAPLLCGVALACVFARPAVAAPRGTRPKPTKPAPAPTPKPAPKGEPEPDRADPSEMARRLYEEGERAFNDGDFRRAGELFESAYKTQPHYSALWNAARAWIRGDDDVRGANLLERYLREAPANAPDRDRATETTHELERKLARIDVVVGSAASAMLDGTPVTLDRVWVLPGEHLATATFDGRPVRKTVRVAAGERVSVSLEPEPEATPEAAKPLPPWVVYVGGGVTILAGGAIALSGIDARDKGDAYFAATSRDAPYDEVASKYHDARSAETRTNVLIGVTVGTGVLTAIAALFFVDWKGDRDGVARAARGVVLTW